MSGTDSDEFDLELDSVRKVMEKSESLHNFVLNYLEMGKIR